MASSSLRPRPARRAAAGVAGRAGVVIGACLAWVVAQPAAAQAPADVQRQLDESQDRLELIRGERLRLRGELAGIAGQVSGDSAELANIERQIGASASLIAELDVQLRVLADRLTAMTRDMLLTRDELTARRVVLDERLRDIYKRGPLRTAQVLFSSQSFSDLLNRYKYLHAIALFDRLLVEDVESLVRQLADQREELGRERGRIAGVRAEKLGELDELGRLERARMQRLRQSSDRRTEARSELARLASEEAELRALIATIEARRRATERDLGAVTVPSLTTSDVGQLAWPVTGSVLWRFGPQREGRTTIPREGIGIAADAGAPVSAVGPGTVASVVARASGQTVIIDHGGGFYSSYQKLREVIIDEGGRVEPGQVIGVVGGDATNPHIEFQIYEPGTSGPRAVDPVRWLRARP